MLLLIGIGLNDPQDITLKGLEAVQETDYVYLENYTSKLQCSTGDLETFYKKKIILADREFVEDGSIILQQAQEKNVALLIIGDVFSATTHMSLYLQAREKNIAVKIVHNASILTAVGITGLQLYKFGKTTSIPFHDSSTPVQVIKANYPLHTLCLLDLDPKNNKYMEAQDALTMLIHKGLDPETKVIACAQLGSDSSVILYTEAKNVKPLGKFPQCIIVPGELHFMEKEALKTYTFN